MTLEDHPHRGRGVLLLTVTTFLWGTTFVVTKKALVTFPAHELVFARFGVAGLVFLPFLRFGKRLWLAALELGALLWAGFATQTVGLRYTTVNRSAFITSLHVVFVPLLAILLGRRTRAMVWVAALLALAGVGLLSSDGSPPNLGDAWTLACAITWAIYIARLETLTAKLPSRALTAAHLWVVILFSAVSTWQSHEFSTDIPWFSVIYLGLAATAATTWFQAMGQKYVTAPQAAVLYTMEPLWATMFGAMVLGEHLGKQGWLGASAIVVAACLTATPVKFKPRIEVPA